MTPAMTEMLCGCGVKYTARYLHNCVVHLSSLRINLIVVAAEENRTLLSQSRAIVGCLRCYFSWQSLSARYSDFMCENSISLIMDLVGVLGRQTGPSNFSLQCKSSFLFVSENMV